MRLRQRLTQAEVATGVGISDSTLSRLERGESMPSGLDIAALLRALGVHGPEFDDLMDLAGEVHQASWVAHLPQQLRTLIDYERTATAITSVNLTAFPGLLQTREYAEAIFKAATVKRSELDHLLSTRLERQDILNRNVRVEVIVDQPVLTRPIGGADVAAGQLRHVLAVCQRHNVVVQVVPYENAVLAAHNSGYLVLQFAKLRPVAYVEHPVGGTFVDQPADAQRYLDEFTTLRKSALNEAASAELMQKSITTLENHQ